MEIYEKKLDDISIYRIYGKLNSLSAADLEKQLLMDIEQGARQLVIDFKSMDYISSAGFGVILKIAEVLKHNGNGKLVLCCLKDYIKEVFEIAGFDMIFSIASSRDEALNYFSERKDSADV